MRNLTLVPTTDLADEHARAALKESGQRAILGRSAITWRELEERLIVAGLGDRRRLEPLARALLVDRLLVTHPVTEEGDATPGVRRAVLRLLEELQRSPVPFVRLHAASSGLDEPRRRRWKAVLELAAAYEHALVAGGLADPAHVIGRACTDVPAMLAAFPDVGSVEARDVLDWPVDRRRLVEGLASALATRGGVVTVHLPAVDVGTLAELVGPIWRPWEAGETVVVTAGTSIGPGALERVSASTRESEARWIAGRVAAAVREGVEPAHIGIAVAGLAELEPLLASAVEAHGLTTRARLGTRLADTRVLRLALELLRLDDRETTTRERVIAIVGSKLVDLRGLHEEAPPPDALARVLREAGVRDRLPEAGNPDGFASRIERLARHNEARRETPDAVTRSAAATLAAFFAELDGWPRSATFTTHGRLLLKLLTRLRVPSKLRRLTFAGARGDVEAAQARALGQDQEAWDRLTAAIGDLSESASIAGRGSEKVPRRTFAAWLSEAVGGVRLRPGATRGGGVELLELGDVPGRRFELLFVAGVEDERIPGPLRGDSLFDEDTRRALNLGIGAPVLRGDGQVEVSRGDQLAAAFTVAVCSADRVVVSRARVGASGSPRGPSPVLAALDVAETAIPHEPFQPSPAAPTSELQDRQDRVARRSAFFSGESASALSGDVGLAGHRVDGEADHPLSAKTLERFANCPFQELAAATWRVREQAVADDAAGPLESGSLAHAAIEAAVSAVVSKGGWSVATIETAVTVGVAAARARLVSLEPETLLGHPDLWDALRERLLRRLARVLRTEIATSTEAGVSPRLLEAQFGTREAPFVVDGLHFTGRIDRVDAGPAAKHVLDYKSGPKTSIAKKVGAKALFRTHFQLPLYALAARQLVNGAAPPDGALVSLRDGERPKSIAETLGSEAFLELEQRFVAAVRGLHDRMTRGEFMPTPVNCRTCALRPVCRIPQKVVDE